MAKKRNFQGGVIWPFSHEAIKCPKGRWQVVTNMPSNESISLHVEKVDSVRVIYNNYQFIDLEIYNGDMSDMSPVNYGWCDVYVQGGIFVLECSPAIPASERPFELKAILSKEGCKDVTIFYTGT